MQALYLDDKLQFRPEQAAPVPGPGEALVRVVLAGICGTDLELLRGYHDFRGIPGHEFVGVVEALGPPPSANDSPRDAQDQLRQLLSELEAEAPEPGDAEAGSRWLGQRVVASINLGSGPDPRHAPDRTVLGILGRHGAFADYVTVPVGNLFVVPPGISDVAAVFCEPLAAALRMADRLTLSAGDRIAVVGPGRLGLLCAEILRWQGHAPTILAHRPERLALPAQLGYVTDLSAYLPDNQFDAVVECSGSADGLAEAIRLTRPLGQVALKSTFAGPAAVAISTVVVKELTLIGSRCGDMQAALDWLARGQLPYDALIAAEYPLHEGLRAFQHAAEPGALKVLLNPWHPDRRPDSRKGETPRPGE